MPVTFLAMPATRALIELLGEVALLLWGVHMVRTGVLRAFGGDLRRLLGRAAIGLGLVLLALHLLVETMAPSGATPAARDLVAAVTREPLPVLLLAALLTWAMHSSVAAVLVDVSSATHRLSSGMIQRSLRPR